MILRDAAPADAPAIAALLTEGFGGRSEADLVAALRADSDAAIELVASDDGAPVGCIMFSPMRVGMTPALALAPVAVRPTHRSQGIGTALVREGLARAAARREAWCVVLGDPAWYARFGFAVAATAGVIGVPWAGHPAFQAKPLRPGVAPLIGAARYACAFNRVSPEIAASEGDIHARDRPAAV